jgi:hypothetical protein
MPFLKNEAYLAALSEIRKDWLQPILDEPLPPRLRRVGEEVELLLEVRNMRSDSSRVLH